MSAILDRYRRWDIVLDGKVFSSVANGQAVEVLVGCGVHTLRVGHRWWASPTQTFNMVDAKTIEFVCRPRPHPMIWVPYAVASLYRQDLFIALERMPARRSKSITSFSLTAPA
jgi:hypothetical protein